MRKSKKLSKNKKPTVVFIYGPIAVGKFTVAEILKRKLGYRLAHNHHLSDFIEEIFERGSFACGQVKEELRFYLIQQAVKAKVNLVATYCYSHDFVYPSGLTEPEFVQKLQRKLTVLGAKFYPVHLKADRKELLKRVGMGSRKMFKKLTDRKVMMSLRNDWQTSPKLKNNFVIDNTNLSPQKVANMIIKHFKLR